MTVTYLLGDTREQIATIPDGSVSLVACSPPFINLRSYLPEGHPMKGAEIGSEPDPASFLNVLLQLTAEWGRVLAPWGSIAVELGDSFSGSGGAGGDYSDDGWRAGQQRFGGSKSQAREAYWSEADAFWLAGVIDTEGSIIVHKQDRGGNAPSYRTDVCVSMMDREVCDHAAKLTGVGNVNRDGRNVYSWHVSAQQARYVLVNIWPHLLIKQRQAKAAIELQRHIEEFRARGAYNPTNTEAIAYREMIREYVSGLNARGGDRGKYIPTWEPPEPPRINHPTIRSIGWPRPKCLALVPQLYAASLAYGRNLLTGEPSPAGQWLVRNMIVWHRPNPAVGALGDKYRPSTSYITVATRSAKRWFDLTAVRGEPSPNTHARLARGTDVAERTAKSAGRGNFATMPELAQTAGAPPLDAWFDEHDTWTLTTQPSSLAHYAMWPAKLAERLILSMCPASVCAVCGEPRRRVERSVRLGADSHANPWDAQCKTGGPWTSGLATTPQTLGWTSCTCLACPNCGGSASLPYGVTCDDHRPDDHYRPGVVLDPFAGTGTTLAVAHLHGRDAIGIDIDARNREMYPARLDECRKTLFGAKPEMPGQLDMFGEGVA